MLPSKRSKKGALSGSDACAASSSALGEPQLVELSKMEHARLSKEADNYAASRAHKRATAQRREWQTQMRTADSEHRAAAAAATRESVRSGMTRSLEENREQNALLVNEQRQRLEEIARHRDALRQEHAKYGRELHERKFGSGAGAQKAQLHERRGLNRKELGRLSAELEAERNRTQSESAAQRSASAGRVRVQSGLHVQRNVFDAMVRQRNVEVRAKRAQSQAWAEATVRHRTMTSSAASTMAFTARERHKAEIDEWRQRVPDFEHLRTHLQADRWRKKLEAAVVRSTNDAIESAAKEILSEGARQRKEAHDAVLLNKRIEAPLPFVSTGAGGIAGSRSADAAASFAARGMPLVPSKKAQLPAAVEYTPAGLRFRSSPYVFERGPLGITFEESPAGVAITEVVAGSAAAALNTPLGGVLLAVNALPLSGMTKSSVQKLIDKANWPMTLQIAPCRVFEFEATGPIGLLVGDSQNGVVVRKLTEGSIAEDKGVPIGALLVAVNNNSVAGLVKAEIDSLLKERPLNLQMVPRDASYLYRPKGVYRASTTSASGLFDR